MRKVSALFLAVAMAASVNVQAASFWDWLNGWGETPKRGMVKTVARAISVILAAIIASIRSNSDTVSPYQPIKGRLKLSFQTAFRLLSADGYNQIPPAGARQVWSY